MVRGLDTDSKHKRKKFSYRELRKDMYVLKRTMEKYCHRVGSKTDYEMKKSNKKKNKN